MLQKYTPMLMIALFCATTSAMTERELNRFLATKATLDRNPFDGGAWDTMKDLADTCNNQSAQLEISRFYIVAAHLNPDHEEYFGNCAKNYMIRSAQDRVQGTTVFSGNRFAKYLLKENDWADATDDQAPTPALSCAKILLGAHGTDDK